MSSGGFEKNTNLGKGSKKDGKQGASLKANLDQSFDKKS